MAQTSTAEASLPTTYSSHGVKTRKKLTGRAFYESIGCPKMILAPMVDQSEFAWRMLTKHYVNESSKALLAYTPMLHSRLFAETSHFRDNHFQPTKRGLKNLPEHDRGEGSVDPYLDGHPSLDRPLFVQFCANSPDDLLEAARYVEPYCDAVDLNLGCPQGIAKKGNYGAFLQEDWKLIYRLINNLHVNLNVPVTAKMRILETKEKTLEYAQMILSAGASLIAVHGRQRDQKGHKTGLADWAVIRYLRDHLPPDTVLFANGNVLRHEDIQKCLEMTGVDGVMSAEGNLCDPAIFSEPPPPGHEGRKYWRGRDGKGGYRMDAVFRQYMDIIYTHVLETKPPDRPPLFLPSDPNASESVIISEPPPLEDPDEPPKKKLKGSKKQTKSSSPNLRAMQSHLFHLLRPLVSKHTHVRDALARSRAGDIDAFENVLHLVEQVTKEGLMDYESDPSKYEENDGITGDEIKNQPKSEESSLATVKECKRPWWVCQPYVRPLPKEAIEKGSLMLSKKELKRLEEEKETRRAGEEQGHCESQGEGLNRADDAMKEQEVAKEGIVCG